MREKVLILGANGLLGNTLLNYFLSKKVFCKGVIRNKNTLLFNEDCYFQYDSLVKKNNLYLKSIKKIINNFKPTLVINCIGITKSKLKDRNMIKIINSSFPRSLAQFTHKEKIKFIHFSTDCVFDGKKGFYSENDNPNAKDIYGLSKFKGEPNSKNNIIFRTSMIGHSCEENNGLLEWFLNQKKAKGFSCMYFSGPTAFEIGKIIYKYVIKKKVIKNGLYNLGGQRISKYNLLLLLNKIYNKKIKIVEDFEISLDRSLLMDKFLKKTNYIIPKWSKMIREQKKFWDTNKY